MEVVKYYDACCDECNTWYSTYFKPLNNMTKKEAIKKMKKNGWGKKNGKTLCDECMTGEIDYSRRVEFY